VEIGEGAFIAAGSTVNKPVPPGGFAIARARQEVKENWGKDPRKQKKENATENGIDGTVSKNANE
jgi:bifunctional UDP-N-acetylglucosamine pyrophosphorylase/glucosamine-1-phosphate N-acetyltransferase